MTTEFCSARKKNYLSWFLALALCLSSLSVLLQCALSLSFVNFLFLTHDVNKDTTKIVETSVFKATIKTFTVETTPPPIPSVLQPAGKNFVDNFVLQNMKRYL
jgi:hypothetical protein